MSTLKNFKIQAEDAHSFTIAHPNGKTLKVSKKDLSKRAHEEIHKMAWGGEVKKMKDGGGVSEQSNDTETVPPTVPTPPAPDPSAYPDTTDTGVPAGANMTLMPSPTETIPQTPATSTTPAAAAPTPIGPTLPGGNFVPSPYEEASGEMTQALRNQMGAQQTAATGAQTANSAIEQIANDTEKQNAPIANTLANLTKKYNDADAVLGQNYQDSKIDPQRLYKNQGAASKVMSAISLVLGGIGSGLTHQPNSALQMMQKNIDDDIAAQQTDQSKKYNLWKMNRDHYNTDMEATLASQNQLYRGAAIKMQQIAATSQNTNALAAAQNASALIEQQIAQNKLKLSMMGATDISPEQKVPYLVPPDQQKQALVEAGNARNANEREEDIMGNFDKAAKDVRFLTGWDPVHSTFVTPESINALQLGGGAILRDADGRPNPEAMAHWNANLPHAWDNDKTVAEKRIAIQQIINDKKQTPTLKAFNVDTSAFRRPAPGSFQPGKTYVNNKTGQKVNIH